MAHIEKRAKDRWRARYRAPDGRERSKTFPRKIEAERWLVEQEAAKATGQWVDPRIGRHHRSWRRPLLGVENGFGRPALR